jgi:hypothetical protein
MKPLIKQCEEPTQQAYGAPKKEPKVVCRTWFESVCNTTYALSRGAEPGGDLKPQTWCQKEPRKICAPDFCEMVEGPEECHDKTLTSTIVQPVEVCDLQPSTHCKLVTNLVPHLESQTVCKEIPKEVCHLRLGNPRVVKKPVTLRWCTKPKPLQALTKPSYLPPPAPTQPAYQAPRQPKYTRPQPPPPKYRSTATQRSSEAPPVYKPRPATPGSPVPTSSPIYYKPASGGRFHRF